MGLNGKKRAYLFRVHRSSDREYALLKPSKKDPSKNAMDCRGSQFLATVITLRHSAVDVCDAAIAMVPGEFSGNTIARCMVEAAEFVPPSPAAFRRM
jgi:hypothetical protein